MAKPKTKEKSNSKLNSFLKRVVTSLVLIPIVIACIILGYPTMFLLALLGANKAVLDLSNEIVTRELRNKVNRQVNCINANINKTVEASLKQVAAINTIIKTIGLESLSEDLQEVAVLRLANQEESLDELLKLSTIKLTRSGLNHRFRKIMKIASTLEE